MDELKIIMEALVKMGDGAQTAFIFWCVKEIFIYSLVPITFGVIGFIVFKIVKFLNPSMQEK